MLILLTRIMHWIPGLLIGLVLLWIFSWLYCKLFCQPNTEKRLISKHKSEVDEIKSRLMFLQSQYDKLLKDKETVDADLQTCRDHSKQLTAELAQANQESERRKDRIVALELYQAKYEETHKKYQDTEANFNNMQLSFGQLQTDHQGLRSDLSERDKEIAGYRSSITDLTVYKDKYNILLPRSEKMEAELKELRAALEAKETTIGEQKNSIFDLEKYKTEVLALGSALALANTAKESHEATNAKLQGEYDLLLIQSNKSKAETSKYLQLLHTTEQELQDKNHNYGILMAQATQLQEDCAYYMNRLDAGEESYQELAEQLRDKEHEYSILMAQAHQLQEDCAFYLNRLDAADTMHEKLTDRNNEYSILMAQAHQLQEDSAFYLNRLDAADEAYQTLTGELKVINSEYDVLMAQAHQLQEDSAFYLNRLDAADESYQTLTGELKARNSEYDILMTQAHQLQEDCAFYLNRLDAADEEHNESKEAYAILLEQATQLQEDSAFYINRLDAAENTYNELKAENEDTQEDYDILKAQANQLQEDCAFYLNRLDVADEEHNESKEAYAILLAQATQLQEDCAFYLNRLDAAEAEHNESKEAYDILLAQATQLQKDCAECFDKLTTATKTEEKETAPTAYGIGNMDDEEALLLQISDKSAHINFDRIGHAEEGDRDDLPRIKGIGPFIERKLNALGIFTFRQIANFNDDDIQDVTKAIEFFPGRIERDGWVPQAKAILEEFGDDKQLSEIMKLSRQFDFERIGRSSLGEKDELQRIKGIGPFIEKKLNAMGIYTFRQISNFTSEDIDTVTEIIQFFPGRIERDDWVSQAAEFAKESKA